MMATTSWQELAEKFVLRIVEVRLVLTGLQLIYPLDDHP
jgi:hypothetical protein